MLLSVAYFCSIGSRWISQMRVCSLFSLSRDCTPSVSLAGSTETNGWSKQVILPYVASHYIWPLCRLRSHTPLLRLLCCEWTVSISSCLVKPRFTVDFSGKLLTCAAAACASINYFKSASYCSFWIKLDTTFSFYIKNCYRRVFTYPVDVLSFNIYGKTYLIQFDCKFNLILCLLVGSASGDNKVICHRWAVFFLICEWIPVNMRKVSRLWYGCLPTQFRFHSENNIFFIIYLLLVRSTQTLNSNRFLTLFSPSLPSLSQYFVFDDSLVLPWGILIDSEHWKFSEGLAITRSSWHDSGSGYGLRHFYHFRERVGGLYLTFLAGLDEGRGTCVCILGASLKSRNCFPEHSPPSMPWKHISRLFFSCFL